ncbi:hypothetical protein DPMN_029079 [Dreissena polymorpha]|uniref:Uncharacterized protein n=1 Tax=Dreissena polymorpha TaxID=45954 RepID=A0A9D4LYG6_DREPO|nr:hypothetical protein DPMN_029079 [Dreissena polymorpha]
MAPGGHKTAPPPGGHVLTPIMTIFELVRDIYKIDENDPPPPGGHKTHVLTKVREDWTSNVTSRAKLPRPLFSPIWTIFELVLDINETNVLTKFHDDCAKIVNSRVFARNTTPPPGGHVFQRTGTIFEHNQYII